MCALRCPGSQKLKAGYPLVITAHSEYSYFEVSQWLKCPEPDGVIAPA